MLCVAIGACVETPSEAIKGLAQSTAGAIPPGVAWVEEDVYMKPVGKDKDSGCTMYTMVSTSPGKGVVAAIFYRSAAGRFVMDKREAGCSKNPE